MKETEKAIGIFDSGLGGLSAVKELTKVLPNENIVYFGDTGRMPYGTKSKETIKKYTKEDVDFLLSHNVKSILAACGTVSSVALDYIKETTNIPVFGIIDEAAKEAYRVSESKNIGVIGTSATINSGKFEEKIREIDPSAHTLSRSCPLFVSLVEYGFIEDKEDEREEDRERKREILHLSCEHYLLSFKGEVDTLILGCTHFPLMKEMIEEILPEVTLIDPTREAVKEMKRELEKRNLLSSSPASGSSKFFVSDNPFSFSSSGKFFLGKEKEIKAERVFL